MRSGQGGKEKEWIDCVQIGVRAFVIAGDWKAMALETEVPVETVAGGKWRFMAVARHHQEKREETRLGKLLSYTEV